MGRIMEQAIGLVTGGAEGAGDAQAPSRTIAASERALNGAIVAADISQSTPGELRESLGLICLELFTSRLPEAERLLSEGRDGSVADGQQFGDRLDLLVNWPEEAKRLITDAPRFLLETAGRVRPG